MHKLRAAVIAFTIIFIMVYRVLAAVNRGAHLNRSMRFAVIILIISIKFDTADICRIHSSTYACFKYIIIIVSCNLNIYISIVIHLFNGGHLVSICLIIGGVLSGITRNGSRHRNGIMCLRIIIHSCSRYVDTGNINRVYRQLSGKLHALIVNLILGCKNSRVFCRLAVIHLRCYGSILPLRCAGYSFFTGMSAYACKAAVFQGLLIGNGFYCIIPITNYGSTLFNRNIIRNLFGRIMIIGFNSCRDGCTTDLVRGNNAACIHAYGFTIRRSIGDLTGSIVLA